MKYYKRPEKNGYFPDFPFNYYEVSEDRQLIVNFLNPEPIITALIQDGNTHDINEPFLKSRVPIPISREEFQTAYQFAVNHPDVKFIT